MPTLAKPLALSVDLDESFVDVPQNELDDLLQLFETASESVRLVYTSHENAEALISIAARAHLPVPEMFLADTGTTALKGDGTGTIEPLQRNVVQLWPGKEAVQATVKQIEGVTLLEDSAPCRQSVQLSSVDAFDGVRAGIEKLGCTVELRHGDTYDVLPYGVDKGTSLGRWLVQENISPTNFLAVGQAPGDLSLFGRGWRGAVFPHADEELIAAASRFHNVRMLKKSGPSGISEALQSFGWLEMSGAA